MASHENREPLIWAACVLGLAALFVLMGLMTPARAREDGTGVPHRAPPPDVNPSAAAEALPPPLDPQPVLHVGHIVFSMSGPLDTPEAAALLARLGGPDPALDGLTRADPTLDDLSLQRAIRDVPGADVHGVMGVIVKGGESAGIGVERITTDPATGVVTGRHEMTVLATVTVLEDGRLSMTAGLRDEHDTSALAVIGRRAGIDLGRTGEADGALVLARGESAVIRLPGRELHVVYLTIPVVRAPAAQGEFGERTSG